MTPETRDWLKVLEDAKKQVDEAYHVFLGRYRKKAKEVYGFVEGKDDPSFFRYLIEPALPEGWSLWLYPAGGKHKVLQCYRNFDWSVYDPTRICFFVDRDFSSLIGNAPSETNIYVTDGYSIENSIANENTFLDVVRDTYQLHDLGLGEEEALKSHWRDEVQRLCAEFQPATAQMLCWRLAEVKANLNNLNMSLLTTVDSGILRPLPEGDLLEATAKQTGATLDNATTLSEAKQRLQNAGDLQTNTRGKQVLWFFIQVARGMGSMLATLIPRCAANAKPRIDLAHTNAVVTIGPRSRCPASLRTFLKANFLALAERA